MRRLTPPGSKIIEFVDKDGRLAALVTVPALTMFWSDGRFERGEAFADHADVFRSVEQASRAFQASGQPAGLIALERAWREMHERFEIRERGASERLTDFGLHLDGCRASVRY